MGHSFCLQRMMIVLIGFFALSLAFDIKSVDHVMSRHLETPARERNESLISLELERRPIDGNYACGTDAMWQYHKNHVFKGFELSDCFNSDCDDPKVRDETPLNVRKMHVVFTVWNNQISLKQLNETVNV